MVFVVSSFESLSGWNGRFSPDLKLRSLVSPEDLVFPEAYLAPPFACALDGGVKKQLKRGRRVGRQAATIPRHGSAVDQRDT